MIQSSQWEGEGWERGSSGRGGVEGEGKWEGEGSVFFDLFSKGLKL